MKSYKTLSARNISAYVIISILLTHATYYLKGILFAKGRCNGNAILKSQHIAMTINAKCALLNVIVFGLKGKCWQYSPHACRYSKYILAMSLKIELRCLSCALVSSSRVFYSLIYIFLLAYSTSKTK